MNERPLAIQRVQPAYQQVAEQLMTLILEGEMKVGDRLPVEAEFASMFGVSRSTMREALRILSSRNLVVTTRGVGGGSFVAEPDPDHVAGYLEASFGLLSSSDAITVEDLLEVRESLEVPAAKLAAERRTDEHLAELRSCLIGNRDGYRIGHRFEGNARFHTTVLEASGNLLLSVVARPVFSLLRTRFLRDQAPEQFWKHVAHDHQEILRFLELGDAESAGDAMQEHLGNLKSTYRDIDSKEE